MSLPLSILSPSLLHAREGVKVSCILVDIVLDHPIVYAQGRLTVCEPTESMNEFTFFGSIDVLPFLEDLINNAPEESEPEMNPYE